MNFGVPAETFGKIPLHALYIFQGEMPGPIEASRLEAQGSLGVPQLASTFRLADLPPVKKTRGGEVRIAEFEQFRDRQDDRSLARHAASGWHARDALAPQRG